MPGIKGLVNEAIVKPVVQEAKTDAGLIAESITSSTPTQNPQAQAQKQQEQAQKKQLDEKKKRNIQAFIDAMQTQEQGSKQTEIKQQQIKQQTEQEEQQKKQVKQFEVIDQQQKAQDINVATKQRKVEIKRGGA